MMCRDDVPLLITQKKTSTLLRRDHSSFLSLRFERTALVVRVGAVS